jgi:hypothetical protein
MSLKEYNVAAILSLLFMAPISIAPALALMYFYISTFRSMCAVPNMAVFSLILSNINIIGKQYLFQEYFEILLTANEPTKELP